MVFHVIYACSKLKSHPPDRRLIWSETTTLDSWNDAWKNEKIPKFLIKDLYTGRDAINQLNIIKNHSNAIPYLFSAGAGLIRVTDDVKIPSYESTFTKNNILIKNSEFLPYGGLSNLIINEGDSVIIFLPHNYMKALFGDSHFEKISKYIVATSTTKIGKICKFPVNVHPRIKEVLGVSSFGINTELIRIFLQDGISGINYHNRLAKKLPNLPRRTKVNDEELCKIVKTHYQGKSQIELIRYIRDNLLISASVERILASRKSIIQSISKQK